MKKTRSFWHVSFSLTAVAVFLLAACATPTPQTIIQTSVVTQVVQQTSVVKETQVVAQTQIVNQTQVVQQTVEVPKQAVTVRLSGWSSSPAETALLESLLYQFSISNTNVIVKYEPITGDYNATINTMVAAGQEPDIRYLDISVFAAAAQNNVLLPLDDMMSAAGVKKEDFVPALINAFTSQGKTYGIPKDFNSLGLFYNKDLFARAKIAEPTDSWTWDDMKAAAQKLTDLSDSKRPIYGLGVPADAGRFPIFAFQNGGDIMKPDFSDTTLDNPKTVAAADFYTSFRKDKSGATPADVGDAWQGTTFGKGQFAMVFEGGWLIPYLSQQFPNTHYGVVHPPAGPAGKGNLIFTVAWVISKNSKNPDAAFKVINFLTNATSQETVLESGFALPSRAALAGSKYFKDNPNSGEIFSGADASAHPFNFGLVGSDVLKEMGDALDRVYKTAEPVDQSMKEAAAKVRTAIKNQ